MAAPARSSAVPAWRTSSRSPEQTAVLVEILERAKRHAGGPGSPVVTFDLDSTLFDNRPRQLAILSEFARENGLAGVERLTIEDIDGWRLVEAITRLEGVEGMETELRAGFKAFWRARFFTSEFCRHDAALPGAPEYVHEVQKAGALVVYLTGRHEAMREGTALSLAESRFPEGTLLVKPTFEMTDTQWKEIAVSRLLSLGTVVACFDNETTHVNRLRSAFPEATVVWLRTDRSPEAEPLVEDCPAIDGFLR